MLLVPIPTPLIAAAPFTFAPRVVATAAASATHYRGTVEDDLGDAKTASLDITKVSVLYTTDGSLKLTLTTNLAMNPKKHDAQFVAVLGGSQCSKPLVGGGGQLSAATQAVVFKPKSFTQFGTFLKAQGKLAKTTYVVRAKYPQFAHKKPDCFSAAFIDPAHGSKIIDEVVASPVREVPS